MRIKLQSSQKTFTGGWSVIWKFIQDLLNRCNLDDAPELKPARRKMSKTVEEDIYWQKCQSYGVNLSSEGCHLVDKESLANNCDADDDDSDEHEDDNDDDDEHADEDDLHQVLLCVE